MSREIADRKVFLLLINLLILSEFPAKKMGKRLLSIASHLAQNKISPTIKLISLRLGLLVGQNIKSVIFSSEMFFFKDFQGIC